MDTQEQNQVEIQSVNPVPNRRPINDLHYTAINSNFRQQSKLNSGGNTSPPGSSAGGSEETKALLPTVGPSGRKFVIVPCQTGGAIGDPGGTVPSGSGGVNGAPIVKVEPGEGSLSSGPSSITVPTAPVGTYLKPKYFNSLRSVRSGRAECVHSNNICHLKPMPSSPNSERSARVGECAAAANDDRPQRFVHIQRCRRYAAAVFRCHLDPIARLDRDGIDRWTAYGHPAGAELTERAAHHD